MKKRKCCPLSSINSFWIFFIIYPQFFRLTALHLVIDLAMLNDTLKFNLYLQATWTFITFCFKKLV